MLFLFGRTYGAWCVTDYLPGFHPGLGFFRSSGTLVFTQMLLHLATNRSFLRNSCFAQVLPHLATNRSFLRNSCFAQALHGWEFNSFIIYSSQLNVPPRHFVPPLLRGIFYLFFRMISIFWLRVLTVNGFCRNLLTPIWSDWMTLSSCLNPEAMRTLISGLIIFSSL